MNITNPEQDLANGGLRNGFEPRKLLPPSLHFVTGQSENSIIIVVVRKVTLPFNDYQDYDVNITT